MTGTVVVALDRFLPSARRIAETLGADLVAYTSGVFADLFGRYDRIVALMSAGIAVRGVAPLLVEVARPCGGGCEPRPTLRRPDRRGITAETTLRGNLPGSGSRR